MADATLAELRNRVLQKLKVLQAGETAEAEDTVLIEGLIVSVNEKLRDLGIAYWSDSACPQSMLEDLAMYVACHAADDYMDGGQAGTFRQTYEPTAERNLRRLVSSGERFNKPTRAEYF